MYELTRSSSFRVWLAIMGAATLIIGGCYTMVQQSTRLGADDLPLATAQTVKYQLDNGAAPQDVVPSRTIDLKTNNNVFVIIADSDHHVIASSAILEGQSPLPPAGTFNYTSAHGTDRFTWQPKQGVRLATRVVSYGQSPNSGFVITGQSLKPFEDRINVYTELGLDGFDAALALDAQLSKKEISLQDQHGIAERIEAILLINRVSVNLAHLLS
jgi:hypothetical protein